MSLSDENLQQQQGNSSNASNADSMDMATVTVSSRIPEFWCDQPRLWFVQCEAILGQQKVGDVTKFNLVVAKLGKKCIQQVSDILLNPPGANKYGTLKTRLLAVYEESENRQFQKLLSEMELGDQRPSQLLRRMRDLARGKISDETLCLMWQGHLPASVRGVLAVCDGEDFEKLAAIADKVMENSQPLHVAAVQANSGYCDNTFLVSEISKLSMQLKELQRGRSKYRNENYDRSTSRSASRRRNMNHRGRTAKNADWLCFYHHRFRNRARKCIEPCAWDKNKNQEN
jgi:hypothetical protein